MRFQRVILYVARRARRRASRTADAVKSWADTRGLKIKNWWRGQHAAHVVLALTVSAGAIITFLATLAGVINYVREVPDREEERALRKIDTMNAAWVRIDASRGRGGDLGQIMAVETLLKSRPRALEYADLSRVDLTQADLGGGVFTGTNFRDSRIVRTRLSGAWLGPRVLEGATVARTDLGSAYAMREFSLRGSSLLGGGLPQGYYDLNLEDSVIEDVSFAVLTVKQVFAARACISLANFSGSEVRVARFSFPDAVLAGVNFSGAYLNGADFRNASFAYAISPDKPGDTRDAPFAVCPQDVQSREALLTKNWSNVAETKYGQAVRQSIGRTLMAHEIEELFGTFEEPSATKDREAGLYSHFRPTNFERASLVEARFEGADLRGVINLTQSQIDLACLDARTRLPKPLSWNGRQCAPPTPPPEPAPALLLRPPS